MSEKFRQTTLTVLGALGYIAFLIAAAAKTAGYPVTWQLIGVILLTSSAMLGVDFGLDIIPAWSTQRSGDAHDNREER